MSYYSLLNTPPSATSNQIQRNFRQLALHLHPDQNNSVNSESFIQI